jgi:hypothetical protein
VVALKKEIPSKYRKHFVAFSPEDVAERVARFRVDAERLRRLDALVACGLRAPARDVTVRPVKPWDPYIHYLEPRTLEDLKEWFGVPHETARANETVSFIRDDCDGRPRIAPDGPRVGIYNLPARRSFTFERLKAPERLAVRTVAEKLLYGPVDSAQLERPPLSAVVKYMLDAAQRLPAFFGTDLLVCPDHTVTFNNVASVYFNNVVIVGNARIELGNQTKFHALQVTHA